VNASRQRQSIYVSGVVESNSDHLLFVIAVGISEQYRLANPFIAVFVAYTYLALDCLGDELEEPFGKEGNDLPLSVLCYNIEANVRDMLQQPITISPPPKQGIYQF